MTSEVAICNLALSHLGDDAAVTSIRPPDESAQAGYCATFYPIARDALLEMFPWPFCTKRMALAEVVNPSPFDWQYAYTLPSTCIRPLSALLPGASPRCFSNVDTDAGSFPYVVEAAQDGSPVLYTNVETAVLRYIDRVDDTTKFTGLFVIALARLLAAYMAGPLIKGDTGTQIAQRHLKIFMEVEFPKAAAAAANTGQRSAYTDFTPSSVAARGLRLPHWPR